MKVTKFEHACLIIEEQGKTLVIDPGSFVRTKLDSLQNVVALVITHVHGDHLDEQHLAEILKNNPGVQIFSTQEVADQLQSFKITVVTGGSQASVEPFNLNFFGGEHAIIHSSFPQNQNVGVLVNNQLYYPGDSFTAPSGAEGVTLALPTSAPWLKIGEVLDFVAEVKPKKAFPTHNALNSELGESLVDQMVGGFIKSQGNNYEYLAVGDSIEI